MRNKGFTLIELLVVIAIIGILAAIIHPMLSMSSKTSRELECSSHLKQMGMATRVYSEDFGVFPKDLHCIDYVLQDSNLLKCPGTAESYIYFSPDTSTASTDTIAACIPPGSKCFPHGSGSYYFSLTAGGSVTRRSQ